MKNLQEIKRVYHQISGAFSADVLCREEEFLSSHSVDHYARQHVFS